MDKNTITGFVLMGLVLVLFTWLGRPSKEELAMQQRVNDSIAMVHEREQQATAMQHQLEQTELDKELAGLSAEMQDSLRMLKTQQAFGEMSGAAMNGGTEQLFELENDSVVFQISSKGGVPVSSELKTYNDYTGKPIRLIRPEDAEIGFSFVSQTNRVISTNDLHFRGEQVSPTHVRMTTTSNDGHELIFHYFLRDKYMLEMQIESKGFDNVIAKNAPYLDAKLALPIYQNEKSEKAEQRYSGIVYELSDGNVEKVSASKSSSKDISGRAKWVALRDMFFSTIAYCPQGLESVSLQSDVMGEEKETLKELETKFALPIGEHGMAQQEPLKLFIYTGPNDYNLLKKLDGELDGNTHLAKVVEMGNWFRAINVWLILPVFNFLERFFTNYGIIILLLTLFVKLILSPFTYKSFLSQAKMRVLKPQVDALAEKYPKQEQMMEKQKATMELYRKAGVNTMGGCLPMLLQMPILFAMYQYFPTSINLRGESFLWANDLSTYDDVIRFGANIPFVGDHLSLFCLLMTVTQIVYMKVSQSMSGQQQMPGMKWMPYIMGVMLFSFLNQNASGLSYYYLLSMLITMLQTQVFRWAINEDKVLAQLEENKKKPRKKSKWMARLEEMQKQQEKMLREQQKNKR